MIRGRQSVATRSLHVHSAANSFAAELDFRPVAGGPLPQVPQAREGGIPATYPVTARSQRSRSILLRIAVITAGWSGNHTFSNAGNVPRCQQISTFLATYVLLAARGPRLVHRPPCRIGRVASAPSFRRGESARQIGRPVALWHHRRARFSLRMMHQDGGMDRVGCTHSSPRTPALA